MTCAVTLWTQNNVTSQKMEYLRRLFPYRTETSTLKTAQNSKPLFKLGTVCKYHVLPCGGTNLTAKAVLLKSTEHVVTARTGLP